jgi:hypothetical protein
LWEIDFLASNQISERDGEEIIWQKRAARQKENEKWKVREREWE